MNKKILSSLQEVSKVSRNAAKNNKTVGLIVGGFDILHMGHLNLFRLARKKVDVVIVGLDNDQTLKTTKGKNRPINNYNRRSQFLSDLTTIDYIFKIGKIIKHGDTDSTPYFENLYKKINPTHIFTHTATDSQERKRQNMAKSLRIKFIPDKSKTVTHTSEIIKKLEMEF